MSIESWNSELVAQWLTNIGLGPFASVLNADNPFRGRELLATSVEELVRVYKIDKKPAKKILVERNKAMAYLHVKPKKKHKAQAEISAPFGVVHVVHVEYIPGKGLKGLPKEWRELIQADFTKGILQRIKRTSRKRDSLKANNSEPKRDSKRLRKCDSYNISIEEVSKWSVAQVSQWLRSIQLPIFVPDFEFAEINGEALITMPLSELLLVLNVEFDKLSEKLMKHISILRKSNKRSKTDSLQIDFGARTSLSQSM